MFPVQVMGILLIFISFLFLKKRKINYCLMYIINFEAMGKAIYLGRIKGENRIFRGEKERKEREKKKLLLGHKEKKKALESQYSHSSFYILIGKIIHNSCI